ncbi:arabinofuranosyltransferase [Streptosporangium sp. NPDC000396]|uniref:arabinofuranosyltransferase n=1 Tax=Streptosporangium sp. NPDC000396 TaxID=3366185 RepID=UPI003692E003
MVSVAVWALGTALVLAVTAWARPDPSTVRGSLSPVAVLGVLTAALLPLAVWLSRTARLSQTPALSRTARLPQTVRRGGDVLAGAVCGLFAAFLALVLRTALSGTPFGFAGLLGDAGRITAAATRYSENLWSGDAFADGVPAEYPPLYPWLIGRASALTGVPAWRLMGEAEVLTLSAAVVAAFVLWCRLVRPPIALAAAAGGVTAFGYPEKAFEVLAVLVIIPWALLTFGSPPRGRLPWQVSGLVGGLMVLTYQGFLIYGSIGLMALMVITWRREPDRRGYVIHLLRAISLAAAIASWYVVPYLVALSRQGGQAVADLYVSPSMTETPLPFLDPTPLGALELAGVAGALWFLRSRWWAQPLLCLVAGAYLYRVIMMTRFVLDGHTGFFHYTTRLVEPVLVAAGVLTAAALARGPGRLPRGVGAVSLAVLLVWAGLDHWHTLLSQNVTPGSSKGTFTNASTARAHQEPLPGGGRTHPSDVRWFPMTSVRKHVEAVMGETARPRTLSYSERLFAYVPWRGFMSVDRTSANTLSRWDDRHAELARLALTADPATFAKASAATRFGGIEVFVLRRAAGDATKWLWRDVAFRSSQFAPEWFTTVTDLPSRTVLAIRKSS